MSNLIMAQMNNTSYSEIVANELLKLKAIRLNFEHLYTWVSGIKSPIYCDNRIINSDVNTREIVLNEFVNLIKSEFKDAEIIAGVATGGIPLGVLIADRLELPFIYVRQEKKKHGLMKQVEGQFNRGDKVVLVEDHVSTGSSSLKAVQGLRNEGLDLLGMVSIMTYGFQEAINLLKDSDVLHYSLCDLGLIAQVAEELNIITASDRSRLLEFQQKPKSFSA
jgi:orotate phosphoribosyltransferase